MHQGAGRHAAGVRGLGDIIVCSVKSVIAGSEVKKKAVVRGVIVRCTKARRAATDGSYVRFDTNAVVLIDNERTRAARAFSAPWPASCATQLHEDREPGQRGGVTSGMTINHDIEPTTRRSDRRRRPRPARQGAEGDAPTRARSSSKA